MSEKNYQSPGPGLNIDDFHPSTEVRAESPGGLPKHQHYDRFRQTADGQHKSGQPMRLSQGGIVGHQQYGNWQEHNQLYQKGGHNAQDNMMMGGMHQYANMPGTYSAKTAQRKKRPQSSHHGGKHHKQSSKHKRMRNDPQWMAQSHPSNWSPGRAPSQLMMPPMMPPPMQAFGPGGPMMAPYDPLGASLTPIGPFAPQIFPTLSDAGGAMTSATTQQNMSVYEETERKNKAKIELLEKKIRAKDQLFEDALASTVASSCACGGANQLENKSLTAELKKRFLKLKARYTEAEQEITRLTKTVKVVEVEVREDTEPFREEIAKLQNEKFDLQQSNARQAEQITDQRLKIEEMERERSQRLIDDERHRGELQLLQERIRSLEEEMKFKVSELEAAQTEIRDFREAHSNFEIQISRLQSELSEASMYKEWYDSKQKEYDDLMKQLEDEQRKLYEKEDEIMALNDKLTQEKETSQELRETITEKNERIKELEEELANRPEIKDDTSSSSSEKPDLSADVEEWKKKYEEMVSKYDSLTSEFEKYKIKATSEIEELTISVTNLEKRNVELKLLLRRNNISLDGSPMKVGEATSTDVVQTNQVVNQVISKIETHHIEEHHESKKVEKTIKDKDSSSSSSDKKKKKKHKKRRKRSSSSSSSYSDRSRDKRRRKGSRDRSRGEHSTVRFDRAEESVGLGGTITETDHQPPYQQASLLMGRTHSLEVQLNERVTGLEQAIKESRVTIEEKEALIQQQGIIIEELRSEILVQERKIEEDAKNNGLFGKLQGAVNDAMYKKKYEDLYKKYTHQQEEFDNQIKKEKENLVEKEAQLLHIVQRNEQNINSVMEGVQKGEPVFHRIELQKAQIEVREKKIFLDKTVIEASDQAKVTVLDRERKLIKAQFQKLFKKQIQDLEANILAYQDLLLTKEVVIKKLERELLEREGDNKQAHLQAEIHNLKKVLEEKLTIIEELRAKSGGDWCQEHDSDDELTQGTCTRAKLKRRVFKKIEHLNEYIRNEVTPEIHQRYAVEIQALAEKHLAEIEQMEKDHKIELYNHAQSYEVKIREWAAETKKHQDVSQNLEDTLQQKLKKIAELEHFAEEQAVRLGELMTDIKKQKTLHEGHIKREEERHVRAIDELRRAHELNISQIAIDKQKLEELYEELKKVTFQSTNHDGRLDILRRECDELKIQIAKHLRTEKQLEEELHSKDSQIQELLDYRKQWNIGKFQKLEDMIDALEKEKAALKAKYKHKVIVKTETIKAELSQELVQVRSELERRSELLERREEELDPLYTRVEELEMMQSSQSLEVKDIHARYKVLISQLKSENASMHKKYLTKIESIQLSLQNETLRVEKAYLDKIEWYKSNEIALKEEKEIYTEHKVEEAKEVLKAEIARLHVIISLYKEKLTRREGENRNILVELKIYKDKVETIRQDFIDEIASLKAELEQKRKEYLTKEREYQAIVQSLEYSLREKTVEIETKQILINEHEQTIIELRNLNQQLTMQIEQLKLTIKHLEEQIAQLNEKILVLQTRQLETKVVEKVVEKIVYRDREVPKPQEPDSDVDQQMSEHESQEEHFEVVGRVKVAESSATFAALERDDSQPQ